MEGFATGLACGLGAGIAMGAGMGVAGGGTGVQKKLQKNLRNLVTDGRIRITDHRGNAITVDQLMTLLSAKSK